MTAAVVTQFDRDVAEAIRFLATDPRWVDKARRIHHEGWNGRCHSRMCRGAAYPCLTRWLADEAAVLRVSGRQ